MKREAGVILLYCLVLLALIGMVAVAGVETLLLQQRVETNMRRARDGFAAADAALYAAEELTAGLCAGAAPPGASMSGAVLWPRAVGDDRGWWQENAVPAQFPGAADIEVRYFIESWRDAGIAEDTPAPVYYRISARGADSISSGGRILQVVGVLDCEAGTAPARLSWREL